MKEKMMVSIMTLSCLVTAEDSAMIAIKRHLEILFYDPKIF